MIEIHTDRSLLPYNTFGLNVCAARFVEYDSADDLRSFLTSTPLSTPYLHIGGGSNLLFTHERYAGTVLHSRINSLEILDESPTALTVRVGAGYDWDAFAALCVRSGWYGAENLSLIPGQVGAAAVQNIGAYGVEIKDFIELVEGVTVGGEVFALRADDCRYAYRHSIFKEKAYTGHFVTHVTFRLYKTPRFHLEYGALRNVFPTDDTATLTAVRDAVCRIRREKLPDPAVVGNAGSFFMNPIVPRAQFDALRADYPTIPHYALPDDEVKIPAAWLIEQCGWKGRACGKCAMCETQSLVLVNLGGATGADIAAFAATVQASVAAKFGIQITPEVRYID
jgi:UDP-N-acetylmuramate dehydrogenase